MTVDQALQRLQAAEVQQLPLASLKTDDALQPRMERLVPFRDRARIEGTSTRHAGTMRLVLQAAHTQQLEPVLVADVDGGLFVVDGHHRLRAYQLAERETIPARVLPMKHLMAVLVSKLVNCADRAMEMHPEQQRDAAWQYLAAVTKRGTAELPAGESLRSIAARFGIGKDTVSAMLRKLPEVNPKDWSSAAHDPGTGFPHWRYVRDAGAGWQDMEQKMTPEQLIQHAAEKAAKKIGAVLDKLTPAAAARALEMLANEAKLAATNADTLAFLADIAEPDTGDF
ncbi:ParB N-terminal domain-containing protein [Rhodanobacter soli]|uniref:ParB-like nuclease family protein n=1 Tax=Rhodanobacter soli TaxID=590609 RepID=A0ABV2PYQ7_9GAMM